MAGNYANVFTFTRSFASPGAVTLLQLKANAARPIEIIRVGLSAYNATVPPVNVQLAYRLLRKTVAATVTSAALSDLAQMNPSNPTTFVQMGTAGSGYLATAEGTDGDVLAQDAFPDVSGWIYPPGLDEREYVPGGGIIALKLLVAAPASTTIYATLRYGEFG